MPGQIDDIKSRLDIVDVVQSYIRLQKAGMNYKALCPFHREKTPSFIVSPARQTWHCFGCSKGGSHFDFVMEIEGLEFRDALELLARRAGVALKREDPRLRSERSRLYAIVEDAAKLFEAVLHRSAEPSVRVTPEFAYLKNRGLAEETIRQWRLGYAPDSWDFALRALRQKGYRPEEIERAGLAVRSEEGRFYDRFRNRIMFPIQDASGRVVGFSGRIFDSSPLPAPSSQQREAGSGKLEAAPAKYINTPETPIYNKSRTLYGFDKAKEEMRHKNAVILVEGQMDVIMSHQAGVRNAIAVSGTALTAQQLQVLRRLAGTIVSSFDRDAAGEQATKRSLDLAAALDFDRKVVMLGGNLKDPADAAAKDPELWRHAVAEAKPVVQFFLESAVGRHSRTSAEGRRAIASAVLPEIRIIPSEVERAHWIQELSRTVELEEAVLWRELQRTKSSAAEILEPQADAAGGGEPNRWRQLESFFLGALILHPGDIAPHLAAFPRHAVRDERHRAILAAVERALGDGGGALTIDTFPDELRETASHLAFQAEVLLERIENPRVRSQELFVCMKELERECAREKLRELSRDISQAEQSGDRERLDALLAEFNTIAVSIL